MKTYKAWAVYEVELELEFDAENIEEAWEFAKTADGMDFKEVGRDGWRIHDVVEVQS